MYGSATELVLTFYGSGVHRFTLDPSLGEFIHIEADVKIPSKPKVRDDYDDCGGDDDHDNDDLDGDDHDNDGDG